MSDQKLVVVREVLPKECPWLEEYVPEGRIVWRYYGHTYGVISPNGIAVTEQPDETPFFELPKAAVREYSAP